MLKSDFLTTHKRKLGLEHIDWGLDFFLAEEVNSGFYLFHRFSWGLFEEIEVLFLYLKKIVCSRDVDLGLS